MSRLAGYLLRLFAGEAAALFLVALALLFLVQLLRVFDLVSVRGQTLLTLVGQSLLAMPPLMVLFFAVCLGIGMARALRQLQDSRELHTIHAGRRLSGLFSAILMTVLGGALTVLLLAHVVDPLAKRGLNRWSAAIAADLVGRTLVPNRFIEVVPGVMVVIGGRQGNGEITDFFADDNRDPDQRRSYIAAAATISADADGYVLQLRDGALQYRNAAGVFSEVAFGRYDMAVELLTGAVEAPGQVGEVPSPVLIQQGLETGVWSPETIDALLTRSVEGLRVIALGLLVAALTAFPHGRRARREMPIEITVLMVALLERCLATYLPMAGAWTSVGGPAMVLLVALVLLAIRLRGWRPVPPREAPA